MEKIKWFLLFMILLAFGGSNLQAQVSPVRFEQLEELQQRDPRPVMILIGTDWCRYCQAMKNALLRPTRVSEIAAQKFYTIFLNAEASEEIVFRGKPYGFKQSGMNTGVHSLAAELGTIKGELAYPALCFLNARQEAIFQHPGYLRTDEWVQMLMRFSERQAQP
jgi:thioredoxin-related protein